VSIRERFEFFSNSVPLDTTQPERANRVQRLTAERAGDRDRVEPGLFLPVRALFALVDEPDMRKRLVGSFCAPQDPEMETGEVFPGIAEDRLDPAVVLHGLPDHEPEQDAQANLAVVLRVHRFRTIPPYSCLEVRPAQRSSIGRGHEEEPAGAPDRGIDHPRWGAERVEINRIKRLFGEEGIGIPLNNLNRQSGTFGILPDQVNSGGFPVADRDRYPAFGSHPDAADTGGSHGIQVIRWLEY